jgi:LacI family transcriptional regulator
VAKRFGDKPTLADVAAAVGLSPAAVSMALRGKVGVSETTRARVIAAARALEYRRLTAVSRQNKKPMTVGLVIKTRQGDAPEANHFYAPIMAGIDESCRTNRMNLVVETMLVDEHYYPIEVPRIVTDRTCDGLIVVGAHLSRATADILRAAPPAVLVDAYTEDGAFDSVLADNVGGARTAVAHLISQGHRNIAILATDPRAFPSILERRRGYEQVIAKAGLTPYYIDGPYWRWETAAVVGVSYLQAHPEITAVFCSHDAVALTLLNAARKAGISVPEQLSVVGFDDIDPARFASTALTTMAVDNSGMGRIAVTLLAHRLEFGNECVTQARIRPTLVERETTRAIGPAAQPEQVAPAVLVDPIPA